MNNILSSVFVQKIKLFVVNHKIWSGVIVLAILMAGYYTFGNKNTTVNKYNLSSVVKGTIVSSVSGSGQVSASNQIDLKSTVSANVTYVGVSAGETVKKGKLLFSLDAADAEKAVRDAETNLESAKLALAKIQEPADKLTVLQTQNAIDQATADKDAQKLAVKNSYDSLLNSTPEAVPDNSTGDYAAPTISGNYVLGKEGEIDLNVYSTGSGSNFYVSGLTTGTGVVTTTVAQPLGDSGLYIKFPSTNVSISKWIISLPNKKASNYLSNYNAYQNTLQSYQTSLTADDRTILENTQKLAELSAGSDVVDVQSKQLAVTQAENSLLDAKKTLENYYITAPFDGTIASVGAQLGQPAGSSALGTIITNQELADIELNEVDVSKIKLGEKATLTFDAINGLSIVGTVASIDAVGTVSSGVVNYNVKISLDTPDSRIKPGMSVNASIITDAHQDVLTVPSSAVKTKNNVSYVEILDNPVESATASDQYTSLTAPRTQIVTTGLTGNSFTEIVSGLNEGDKVISKTINSGSTSTTAAKTTTPSATSLLSGGGRTGGVRGN